MAGTKNLRNRTNHYDGIIDSRADEADGSSGRDDMQLYKGTNPLPLNGTDDYPIKTLGTGTESRTLSLARETNVPLPCSRTLSLARETNVPLSGSDPPHIPGHVWKIPRHVWSIPHL